MTRGVQQAYLAGLKLLARRELSEAQVRTRLSRRGFEPDDIEDAVARLRNERAIDDRRVALACARTETRLRCRGRARVLRQVEGLGIDRDTARAAVAEVFAELDETALLERALATRLARSTALDDARRTRRIFRYLIAQGFEPERVSTALRSIARNPESQLE